MTKTKIYCDHCGKELNEMHDYIDVEIDMGVSWLRTDLCQECMHELKELVYSFCEKAEKKEVK